MRFGLHALGIGPGAQPEVIRAVAESAEAAGFATLWSGQHVVMLEGPDTRYPYSEDGRIAVPLRADWLDPWATLTFAAAVTARIRLATGILLLPEHNPLVVAKQAASLDVLSKGRFVLGVGMGWSAGEFAALGVPFAGRADRLREYLDVIRLLWREGPASYEGTFVQFSSVSSYPKPVQDPLPIVLGGNSDAAVGRVAALADGWYGFNLDFDEVGPRLDVLRSACRTSGRDPEDIDVAVALRDAHPGHVAHLDALGVTELVIVEAPPDDPRAAAGWIDGLADHWSVDARR